MSAMNRRALLAAVLVLLASACSTEGALEGGAMAMPAGRQGGQLLEQLDDGQLLEQLDGGLVSKLVLLPPDQMSSQSWADIYIAPATGNLRGFTKLLPSAHTHVCFLSAVRGDLFVATKVLLGHDMVGGDASWMLSVLQTKADAGSIAAESICVPAWSFFTEGSATLWYSDPVNASVGTGCLSRAKEVTLAPDGMGVGFLTGVFGQFEGGGEYAQVSQSSSAPNPWKLRVHAAQCATHHATAREFIVASDARGFTLRSEVYEVSSNGTARAKMRKTQDAVCYLTRISGNMDGQAEGVRIFPEMDANGVEWWILQATAGGGSAYGSAQCVFYDQDLGDVIE